ncbi:cysteine hydrolase [Variovorax sp. J22R133]|uniref:cysteine hydrolase family protein n=1 Tax=Variovorax brevis TaxID=3053503 RepID=UPI0025762DD9|nr:cysteine hydrolase [Variovorax sp. J22R133]MDM0114074.1 cysteine hydrolase [Variovorax sp. J22R133]
MADIALIALHYQNDVLHPDGKIRVGMSADSPVRAGVIAAAKALLQGAREREWPIVHVRIAFRADFADLTVNAPIFRGVAASGAVVEGAWGSEFFEGLAPLPDSRKEFVVKHQRVNAFYGSPLDDVLRLVGARRLVIAGVATHSVVESTVRHAVDMGYTVTVAADACAAAQAAEHEASLHSMGLIATIARGEAVFS